MTQTSPLPSTDLNTSEIDRKMQDLSMKLSISRDKLFSALQTVGRAVSARATLPSLGGIELSATSGVLTLRATDMEIGLVASLSDVSIETEGTVLLPGRL